jgi:hypothetical protein
LRLLLLLLRLLRWRVAKGLRRLLLLLEVHDLFPSPF